MISHDPFKPYNYLKEYQFFIFRMINHNSYHDVEYITSHHGINLLRVTTTSPAKKISASLSLHKIWPTDLFVNGALQSSKNGIFRPKSCIDNQASAIVIVEVTHRLDQIL